MNLLEVLADTIYVREGERTDVLTSRIKQYSKTGEFDELTDHVKHRLHAVRSVQRLLAGNPKHVYKTYVEAGRQYIIVFDRSGSMAGDFRGVSKKAVASIVALLIAKADPEAIYSLITFDRSAKVVAVRKSAEEIADEVVEVEAKGGTSYVSGLTAAEKVMEQGDVIVVIGDFLDGVPLPETLAEGIKSKAGKTILIPVGGADISYARRLARQLNGEIYTYRNGVFTLLPS